MRLRGKWGPRLLAPLLAALVLAPLTAGAQGAQTGPDAIERTADDLGTWDAVLVGRNASGRWVSARGVEINTLGCAGACIVTKVEGALNPPAYRGLQRAWWDSYDGVASSLDVKTGLPELRYVPGEMAPGASVLAHLPSAPPKGTTAVGGVPASRTSVEYPTQGRRVVRLYRQRPDGTEMLVLRITYTRRD